ncbi:6968_t:CDS:2 [Dentiscutata heterogama]|uniref:6968_t:CDS:1 n=1 Tax=Dentiscutata heterogama TaxID=1316150 RepID=A0ACA9K7L9_9GLOM|nr:6968_t:CDS:2 [Dentiscutata heterogama]
MKVKFKEDLKTKSDINNYSDDKQSPKTKKLYEDITNQYDRDKLKKLTQEKIQNSNVQQFWTDITRCEEDRTSSSNDPDISNNCLPYLNLTLESEFSDRIKSSINEILQSWIIAWKKDENLDEKDYTHLSFISPLNKFLEGPEHPTYCSYERKSHFFESSFEDREIFDLQIFNQFSLESVLLSDDSKITDEIKDTIIINNQNPKVYHRSSKNDYTVVEKEDLKTPDKINKERGEKKYGYIYPILGEVKLPGINGKNDYKKNIQALNDNFNTIIKYYSKKVNKVSSKLCRLFDEGEIYLLQYVRFTSQNFGVLIDICSAKIPSKLEIQHAGQMIDFLFCIKCMVQEFINQIKKIEEEIKKINEYSDDSLEEFETPGEFLKNNILTTPSSPIHKS